MKAKEWLNFALSLCSFGTVPALQRRVVAIAAAGLLCSGGCSCLAAQTPDLNRPSKFIVPASRLPTTRPSNTYGKPSRIMCARSRLQGPCSVAWIGLPVAASRASSASLPSAFSCQV